MKTEDLKTTHTQIAGDIAKQSISFEEVAKQASCANKVS